MSKLSFSVYLNTYSDSNPSNNASLNNFKWARDLSGLIVNNPSSRQLTLAPGETRSIFSGVRTLLQDNTTVYSIALKPLSSNTYVLSAIAGTLPNFRTPRSIGTSAASAITVTLNGPVLTFSAPNIVAPAVAASFTGQPAGLTTPVTLTAVTSGAAGNGIAFSSPDGLTTLADLVTAWNTGNPSNQVAVTAGDDTQIPVTGAVFQLAGGSDSTSTPAIDTTAIVIGDFVQIGAAFNVLNQGVFQIISKTATSFSVSNEGGANEGPITLGSSYASQISVFSAAGVQIGDTLVISGGFSPASWGSYEVTAVTANTVEFYETNLLPQESGIMTQAIAIYSDAKQLIYLEADSKVSVILNGVAVANIEPFVVPGVLGSTTQPGVFMLKSTVYSLSLQNVGINPANVFFAAVE